LPIGPDQMLLHYRLVDKLGEGGMGVVWRAVDTTLDREVAIKVLADAFVQDPDRLARFEREAKLLASLNHPNIAAVYSVHEAEGCVSWPWSWSPARTWRSEWRAAGYRRKRRCASGSRSPRLSRPLTRAG